jgi:hypothetical protein
MASAPALRWDELVPCAPPLSFRLRLPLFRMFCALERGACSDQGNNYSCRVKLQDIFYTDLYNRRRSQSQT